MGDDSARRLILARRARFVAAALAGVTATAAVGAATEACGGGTEQTRSKEDAEAEPQPCLGVDWQEEAGPQPCLSVDAQVPEDAGDEDDAEAGPQPCLIAPLDGG